MQALTSEHPEISVLNICFPAFPRMTREAATYCNLLQLLEIDFPTAYALAMKWNELQDSPRRNTDEDLMIMSEHFMPGTCEVVKIPAWFFDTEVNASIVGEEKTYDLPHRGNVILPMPAGLTTDQATQTYAVYDIMTAAVSPKKANFFLLPGLNPTSVEDNAIREIINLAVSFTTDPNRSLNTFTTEVQRIAEDMKSQLGYIINYLSELPLNPKNNITVIALPEQTFMAHDETLLERLPGELHLTYMLRMLLANAEQSDLFFKQLLSSILTHKLAQSFIRNKKNKRSVIDKVNINDDFAFNNLIFTAVERMLSRIDDYALSDLFASGQDQFETILKNLLSGLIRGDVFSLRSWIDVISDQSREV